MNIPKVKDPRANMGGNRTVCVGTSPRPLVKGITQDHNIDKEGGQWTVTSNHRTMTIWEKILDGRPRNQ